LLPEKQKTINNHDLSSSCLFLRPIEEGEKTQFHGAKQDIGPASLSYSVDLTMKFWRLMGFMMTGGPAVRGQAWNLASVVCHHSLSETVLGMVPISKE
jgi:hypothetical protein